MRMIRTLGVIVVLAGCASNTPPALPDTGTLTVGVSGSGTGIEQLVLDVRVDGTVVGRVNADGGVFTSRRLAPADHVVALAGLPAGCRTQAPAERSVRISAGQTTAVRFVVQCNAPVAPRGSSRPAGPTER